MTVIQSILLGIIQGLTEFLPISSSAHLVIAPYLFGWKFPADQAFIFDVLVQLGTLVAVIVYFWKDLYKIIGAVLNGLIRRKPLADPYARLGWLLVLGTIPAIIAGVLFKDAVERAFASPLASGLFLLLTAAFLVAAEILGRRNRHLDDVSWLDALIVGCFQAVSLLPGVSRSGSTITGGMLRHLDRLSAARFSFLMSVPAMIGAGSVAVLDLVKMPNVASQVAPLIAGFVLAAVVGYLAIHWLLSFIAKRPLYIFSIYCVALSVLVIILSVVRH